MDLWVARPCNDNSISNYVPRHVSLLPLWKTSFSHKTIYFTRSCAALRAADLDWIVGPEYSLGGYIWSTSSWVAMRTEKITSAMMVEKSKTDFFVCVSILFFCKIRFKFVNWFFLLFPWIARYFLQCLKKENPNTKELDLRPLSKVIIFRPTRGVTTDLLDV